MVSNNGGALHIHLRRAVRFDKVRALFYSEQGASAVLQPHTYNNVYRDPEARKQFSGRSVVHRAHLSWIDTQSLTVKVS